MAKLIDAKKIMKESRVALSRDVCDKLGVAPGDIVSFVEDDGEIIIRKAVA